jgi:hypothetical protein
MFSRGLLSSRAMRRRHGSLVLCTVFLASPWLAVASPSGRGAAEPAPGALAGAVRSQDLATDPQDCARCHEAFHAEWRDGAHAKAFVDPIYQAALRGLDRPERWHGCHAPDSVLRRIGFRPKVRDADLAHGVHCASCHASGDVIHGPYGATTDAHATRRDPAFRAPDVDHLCASCHATKIGPVLPVAKDFLASTLREEGKSCVDCHMPRIERPLAVVDGKPSAVRWTRDHRMRGPSDPEFLASAFTLAVRADGDDVELLVTNEAGHRVPGLTLRSFPIVVAQLDADRRELRTDTVTISSENELATAETRHFRFRRLPNATRARVVLEHRFQGRRVAVVRTEEYAW